MALLTAPDIAAIAPQARALLINSLPGYKSAMLVATCDAMGQTNLAIVSSHFHLGSSPPLLAMILRPSTGESERHTLHNLLETRCWSLNGFSLDHAAQAHQTSAPYPKDQSEFDACDFEAEWLDEFGAPFIKGSPLKIGCLLREHHPLEINGTHMIIGEVQRLQYPDGPAGRWRSLSERHGSGRGGRTRYLHATECRSAIRSCRYNLPATAIVNLVFTIQIR